MYEQYNGHVHLKDNCASSFVLLSGRENVRGEPVRLLGNLLWLAMAVVQLRK